MAPSSLRYALAITALLVTVAGCAPSRRLAERPTELPDRFPRHSLEEIDQLIRVDTDTLTAFRGKASLALRSPQQSGQFSADIRSRRDDSLYLSISPGLGIEAARALVTPDSFFLYNRIENEVTYGSIDRAAEFLPAPLASGDLFRNLLGLSVPEVGPGWQLEATEDRYLLRDPSGLQTYVIDPALWRIVRYEARTPDGVLVEERTYSDFDRFDGVFLPRQIVFERPAEEILASIYYRDLALNPREMSFPFRTSPAARRNPVE